MAYSMSKLRRAELRRRIGLLSKSSYIVSSLLAGHGQITVTMLTPGIALA